MRVFRSAVIVATLLVTVTFASHAQVEYGYLEVGRNALIKEVAKREGRMLYRTVKGDILVLLEDKQTNGYFKVKHVGNGAVGYVYRTLVRRRSGTPPGLPESYSTQDGDLEVFIVDVGGGLCNIIKLPDGRFILYDVGHYRGSGSSSARQIEEIIPHGSPIELMVLSHTDADHIGAAGQVLSNYRVKRLLRTGFEKSAFTPTPNDKPTATYRRMTDALNHINYPIDDVSLNAADSTITPGTSLNFGLATVRFLSGFGKPENDWGRLSASESINSVSIVMKVEYAGRSVLFCGDAVGKHLKDKETALIASEKYLIDNAKAWLKSDIIIAPHHGTAGASTKAFVDAVQPEKVIFSAGHAHNHPTVYAANQYLKHVSTGDIFRTDRGDDERDAVKDVGKGDRLEWSFGRINGCLDSYGDDDVKIVIARDGKYKVNYVKPDAGCDINPN